MNKCVLGIDTSNYRTSVSLVDLNEKIIANERKLLQVKKGELGLQQSYALFQHIQNLPQLIEKVMNNDVEIVALSASTRPRNIEGSYMPVFLAGESMAKSISASLNVPCYFFSHQEGHFASARLNTPLTESDRYIAFHFSGGTTEAVLCENNEFKIVGGSLDLALGQVIDRVGVKLGYEFPAGKYLDEIVTGEDTNIKITPVKVKDGFFNLSGLETQLYKLIEQGIQNDVIVNLLFSEILSLIKMTKVQLKEIYNVDKFLFAGGVSSSRFIQNNIDGYFTKEDLSGDNAVGIALLGGKEYGKKACNNNTTK